MHIGDIAVGALPAIAIVAGGMPVAVGVGLSCKMRVTRNVVVCFFGDGATNEGAFHESMNAAAIWNLPVIFACENNLYGASTRIGQMVRVKRLSDRAAAYGMPGETIDGNDVFAVNNAAAGAIERARNGGGPTLLELLTWRIGGHSRNDASGYRNKDEEAEWRAKDPLICCRARILAEGWSAEQELEQLEERVLQRIDAAVEYAKACPDPKPEDALRDLYYERGR
jgi:acetoin:2,6-dichlorophenolindophenol oxidoreductase subunit alpha